MLAMQPDLLLALRTATRDLHRAIEDTPISRAIVGEAIDRETYGELLANLADMHALIEHELCRQAGRAEIGAVFHEGLCRAEAARRDLGVFGIQQGGKLGREVASEILASCAEAPALAGVVYVLEGSRMGSTVLSRKLASAFELELRDNAGLDYHLHRRALLGDDFRALITGLSSLDRAVHPDVVKGAMVTFTAIARLYEARPMRAPLVCAAE